MPQLNLKKDFAVPRAESKRALCICLPCRGVKNGSPPSWVPAASLTELKGTCGASVLGLRKVGTEKKNPLFHPTCSAMVTCPKQSQENPV